MCNPEQFTLFPHLTCYPDSQDILRTNSCLNLALSERDIQAAELSGYYQKFYALFLPTIE
jgi:hypothetical protein